ncbi:MAG TPA: proline racemase family protein [Methylomirabilota bacterium]
MKWARTVTVIGCHVGGEDNHVIVGGVLPPPGATMFEKKRYLETRADELRRWLLLEPRGKPALCMNLVVPPTRADCDAGLIIMESTDYPPMSGSNTICTVTVLLETGMLPMREPVTALTLDTPAGPVPVEARCRDGKVERVQFTNVPCFATHLGAKLDVEGLGTIAVDVAYGGAFFAIVDAPSLGFAVEPKEARELVMLGNRIVAAARQQLPVQHPENVDIQGVTFAEFAMPFAGPGTVSRNAVIVAPGRIDRSPCGTGTCARMAVLHARGQLGVGQAFVHESIIGSQFDSAIAAEVTVGGRPAIVPTIAGQAWITGVFQHGADPSDPFRGGFTLPDMWLA